MQYTIYVVLMKINLKKLSLQSFIPLSEAEMKCLFIQLKTILDIIKCGFSLSSCPQHNLKVALL
jgi:hypothetical protein